MTYRFGARSEAKLQGVHPALVAVVRRALELSPVDFSVTDGLRTPEVQSQLVLSGASKTLKSKHLKQGDGYGHAVDLVPYIDGSPRWEWPLIYPLAVAVRQAAIEHHTSLRWGGVWDRNITDLPATAAGLKQAVEAYCQRHPGPDFLDGPHYELML